VNRREVLATLATLSTAGCSAPVADCPSVAFEGEEVCPSHDLGVRLTIDPATVELPAELEFTVVNRTDYRFVFPPEQYPLVYRHRFSDWEQVAIARRMEVHEPVVVTDAYTFTQEYPFYKWNPKPGQYMLLFAGHLETRGGERQR
jgi:hypothetical protein